MSELERWLRDNKLTSLRNGNLFMSYVNDEDAFILYSKKGIENKSKEFDAIYKELMGKV